MGDFDATPLLAAVVLWELEPLEPLEPQAANTSAANSAATASPRFAPRIRATA
jgi:hypothetical protein